MNYSIKKSDLPGFLQSLSKKHDVWAPAECDSGATMFAPLGDAGIYLGGRTDFSPKFLFRPPQEKMFVFRKNGSSYDVRHKFDSAKRVVFGIRPCDTHALNVLDELFIRYYGDDQFYTKRRRNTMLIALQCKEACESGFCTSMGTSRAVGHDLLFIERGSDFFVSAASERGKKLLDRKFFKPTKDAAPSVRIDCKKRLETKNLGPNLYANFSHPAWKSEGERCLSCTSCTQICPTCYCYYTDDSFVFGSCDESERFRYIDSCQLQRFTKVAGGHVFRKARGARLRQFVLHKLHYYQEQHGLQLCVGCGRCISACPVKIDLTKIANEIQQEALGGKK